MNSQHNKSSTSLDHSTSFDFDFALCHNYGWCDCCRY